MSGPVAAKADPQVGWWTDFASASLERHRRLWLALGEWESRLLKDRIEGTPIESPIYVCGLARSGSTILLELLARHRHVTTHRYRDFPPVFTPWAWNRFVDRAGSGAQQAQERAHHDRIKVTPESPEAFEEVLWMAFFPTLHDAGHSAVLDAATSNPRFEAFYRDHIRKLLLLRDGRRYLAKANYNTTRLAYLLKLFPDARFVVPVRDPLWHIASLMKQHALFCGQQTRNRRVLDHMRRAGHFEFGLDRRPVAAGDPARAQAIAALWDAGREVEGWAEHWALVYGHILDVLDADEAVRAATRIVRYEDLCASPAASMSALLEHCRLDAQDLPARAQAMVSAPEYYRPAFDETEMAVIEERTGPVARRLGY